MQKFKLTKKEIDQMNFDELIVVSEQISNNQKKLLLLLKDLESSNNEIYKRLILKSEEKQILTKFLQLIKDNEMSEFIGDTKLVFEILVEIIKDPKNDLLFIGKKFLKAAMVGGFSQELIPNQYLQEWNQVKQYASRRKTYLSLLEGNANISVNDVLNEYWLFLLDKEDISEFFHLLNDKYYRGEINGTTTNDQISKFVSFISDYSTRILDYVDMLQELFDFKGDIFDVFSQEQLMRNFHRIITKAYRNVRKLSDILEKKSINNGNARIDEFIDETQDGQKLRYTIYLYGKTGIYRVVIATQDDSSLEKSEKLEINFRLTEHKNSRDKEGEIYISYVNKNNQKEEYGIKLDNSLLPNELLEVDENLIDSNNMDILIDKSSKDHKEILKLMGHVVHFMMPAVELALEKKILI